MATLVASADTRLLDNKYEIIREIKQGGFGIVYTGIDRKLNKLVAIKEIAPSLVEDPKYLDMFQEEAINIAKLNHTNIVHVYEFTKAADGRLYIIMEYIDGTDLEKIVRFARRRHTKIPPPLAIFIASQVCMALDYAHNRRDAFSNKPLKLVHQDISPSNIMISKSGEVKLIDFGIASVKRHRSPNKKDNKVRGKIPYMTPEQLMEIPGVGEKMVQKIADAVKQHFEPDVAEADTPEASAAEVPAESKTAEESERPAAAVLADAPAPAQEAPPEEEVAEAVTAGSGEEGSKAAEEGGAEKELAAETTESESKRAD